MAKDGTIKIYTELDTSAARKAMSQFSTVAEKSLKLAAEATVAVGAGLITAGGYAIKVGSDFETGMSQVKAISGATACEMEQLTEKAKEMGAKTKFSASESAEAFNYMAMAGWKTGDMLSGIEGIMNLAAASGEDLGLTSDIVTDALTAFGMSASDSGHFADVLAKASSNANTNVSMMGETFKYVAPVAGALGYSVEDTALAIGLMANSGIKAGNAGTALRGMLARLAKPTNEVQGAMDELGVSLVNTDGTMKSLDEVMLDMRDGFSGLSEAERASTAASLAGQEAMSGLLAIVSASDEDFNKLSESINNADGATKEMAETMEDNFQGQVTILTSAIEGLGIEVYESMEVPLKKAAIEGSKYVDMLTDAFKEGGLNSVIKEAGKIFGELATKAAQQAPQMINASVDFIQAFANGIYDNRGEITEAAKDIVMTFAGGMTKLLPKSVRKAADDAIKELSKSMNSGGLKTASEAFITAIKNISNVMGKLTDKALPALVKTIDFAGEHIGVLAGLVTACTVAYKGMDVVNSVGSIIKKTSTAFETASLAVDAYNVKVLAATMSGQAANVSLTTGQAAVGMLTGKVSLATVAHTAWNAVMNANPIGLVVTAVAALAAGIAIYKLTTDDVMTAEEMQAQRLQEISNKVSEQKTKWEELERVKQEQLDADLTLVDHTQNLWDELQTIIDANGKVKKGYEDRAAFITGELSEALDIELEYIDNEVKGMGEVEQSIDSLIQKKKANIILDANAAQYTEALQKTREMEMAQAEAKRKLDEQQNLVTEKQIELSELQSEKLTSHKASEWDAIMAQTTALKEEIAQEERNLSKKQQIYNEATGVVGSYYNTITDYENLSAAIMTGNAAEMQTAIEAVNNSRKTSTTIDATELAIQLLNQKEHISLLREEVNSGMKGITEDKIKNAENELVAMQAEYDKAVSNLDSHTNSIAGLMDKLTGDMTQDEAEQLGVWLGMVSDAQVNGKEISDETLSMVNKVIENLDKMPKQTRETMKNAMSPMLEEMENSEPSLFEKASGIANGILSRLKKAFDINSPSKKTRNIFQNVMKGARLGLKDEEKNIYSQTEGMSDTILDRLNIQGVDCQSIVKKILDVIDSRNESMIPMSVRYETTLARTSAESRAEYDTDSGINYDKLGDAVRKALKGVKVVMDGRTTGEVLTPHIDRCLGDMEKWKERG